MSYVRKCLLGNACWHDHTDTSYPDEHNLI